MVTTATQPPITHGTSWDPLGIGSPAPSEPQHTEGEWVRAGGTSDQWRAWVRSGLSVADFIASASAPPTSSLPAVEPRSAPDQDALDIQTMDAAKDETTLAALEQSAYARQRGWRHDAEQRKLAPSRSREARRIEKQRERARKAGDDPGLTARQQRKLAQAKRLVERVTRALDDRSQ